MRPPPLSATPRQSIPNNMTTRKITHYGIVVKDHPSEMVSTIDRMIADGWQPYGPPTILISDGPWFYQTMVIYEKAEAL